METLNWEAQLFIWGLHSLVVEHNVRQPDVLGGHIELCDTTVFRWIPFEFMILPLVLQPHIGR